MKDIAFDSITKGFDASQAYEAGFSGVPEDTVYHNPLSKSKSKFARQTEEQFLEKYIAEVMKDIPVNMRKALTTSSITAPTIIDAEITDRLRRETPVLELIPRVTQRGITASYDAQTARSAAAFLGQGASLNDQDDTYTNPTATVKFSYAVGGVTGPGRAHEAHFIDALAEVMRSKTVGLRELHEEQFLTGTVSATAYDGMDNLITTNSTAVSSTVSLDNVGTLLDSTRARGGKGKKIGICPYSVGRDIKSQMMQQVHYIDPVSIAWGLQTFQYEDMPIVLTRFGNQTSTSMRFYIVDTEVTQYRVLQEPTMETLAKTYDADRFFIKEYSVPIVKHEARNGMLTGLT